MPGLIDPTQALRLLREIWPDPTMLAQELYAILTTTAKAPMTVPLTLAKVGTQAPIQLQGYSNGDSVIQVTGPQGDPVGSFILTDGGLEFVAAGSPTGGGTTTTGKVGSGNVAFGKVISGTGDTYQVDVYQQGRSRPATRQSVKQVQIDTGETIPAGTWVVAIFEPDRTWSMQVPIWL